MPAAPMGGWDAQRDTLKKRAIAALENYAPGLKDRILAAEVLTPTDIALRYGASAAGAESSVHRLLTPYDARVRTPLQGLYLCGGNTEPTDSISGRAGRIAAKLALAKRSVWKGRAS
jgi:phytoene dehydrogenase-like protein